MNGRTQRKSVVIYQSSECDTEPENVSSNSRTKNFKKTKNERISAKTGLQKFRKIPIKKKDDNIGKEISYKFLQPETSIKVLEAKSSTTKRSIKDNKSIISDTTDILSVPRKRGRPRKLVRIETTIKSIDDRLKFILEEGMSDKHEELLHENVTNEETNTATTELKVCLEDIYSVKITESSGNESKNMRNRSEKEVENLMVNQFSKETQEQNHEKHEKLLNENVTHEEKNITHAEPNRCFDDEDSIKIRESNDAEGENIIERNQNDFSNSMVNQFPKETWEQDHKVHES